MNRRCRLTLLLASVLVAGTSFGQQKGPPDTGEVATLVVRLTNEFRARERRDPVAVNARLAEAARHFAEHMAQTGKLSHDADGATPAARARRRGYDYCMISENIGYQYSSTGFGTRELAQGFVAGWENSPGHRKNMADPDVTETAAAVARGNRDGHYYAVQLFGRPASRAITFSIANRSSTAVRYRIGGESFPLAPRQTRTHTQCKSAELKFVWPDGRRDTAITPKGGERLAVVRSDSGGLALTTE